MALEIIINYPDVSETTTQADLVVLKKFENILMEMMPTVMCSTSNYRWEREVKYKSDAYYSLIKISNSQLIGTFGIRSLVKLKPEVLLDGIRIDQVLPPKNNL